MARTKLSTGIGGGIAAGLFAGLVLSLFLLGTALAAGGSVWRVLAAPSAPVLGERALQDGFDFVAVVLGVAIHFAIAALWGGLFGLLFRGLGRFATVAGGAVYGIGVWVVMFFLVLPLFELGTITSGVPMSVAVLEHVLFGLTLGMAFVPFQLPQVERLPSPVTHGT